MKTTLSVNEIKFKNFRMMSTEFLTVPRTLGRKVLPKPTCCVRQLSHLRECSFRGKKLVTSYSALGKEHPNDARVEGVHEIFDCH